MNTCDRDGFLTPEDWKMTGSPFPGAEELTRLNNYPVGDGEISGVLEGNNDKFDVPDFLLRPSCVKAPKTLREKIEAILSRKNDSLKNTDEQVDISDRLGLYSGRTGIKKIEVDNRGKKANLEGQLVIATYEEKKVDPERRINVKNGKWIYLESINSEPIDERIPDGIDILETLKNKRRYPLPVDKKWIEVVPSRIKWKGVNEENEYELTLGNFLILRKRLQELVENENTEVPLSLIKRFLSTELFADEDGEESLTEELLSNLVVIKGRTRLYEPGRIDAYADLNGHIIALPGKTLFDANGVEYGKEFIYIANASEKEKIYKKRSASYRFYGGTRDLFFGTAFQVRNKKACLVNSRFFRE